MGHQTCNIQVVDSSPGWAPLRSLEQATYTCVPLTKQYNLVPAMGMGVISLTGKVTAGWWKVTAALAAYHQVYN